MSFASPAALVSLVLVPLAILAYVVVQRRRVKYAMRFTNLDLLANVVERSPGWRRHLPPLFALVALASLLVALAFVIVSAAPGEARNVRHGGHVNVNNKVNVSKKNVNINRKVNVDVNRKVHRDVDVDWDYNHRHPVATGVAVGTAAAITAAAIGSIAYSVPASCRYQTINGVRYYHCGDTWYEQRYSGSQLVYVVVPRP
jgi:hypothetical protein